MDNFINYFLWPGLVALVSSSVTAVFISHLFETFRTEKQIRLAKLEEYYLKIQSCVNNLAIAARIIATYDPLKDSEKDLEKLTDLQRDSDKLHGELKMYCNFYFQDLQPLLMDLITQTYDTRKVFNKVFNQVKVGNALPTDKAVLNEEVVKVNRIQDDINRQIFRMADEIKKGKFVMWLRDFGYGKISSS